MELEKEVKDECVVISEIKKTRGRPKKDNKLTDDKDYFNKRHHATNVFIKCEDCGCVFRKKSMKKHLTTRIHLEGIKLKEKEKVDVNMPIKGIIFIDEPYSSFEEFVELIKKRAENN
jgi:predicted transcriptional regulator